MRVITWNMRRATKNSRAWDIFTEINPDIALLQEVTDIPDIIKQEYETLSKHAIYKTGKSQKFSTTILTRGKIVNEISLSSTYDRVNSELEFFKGNIIGCTVQLDNNVEFNLISVYSPAWPVDISQRSQEEIKTIKLKDDNNVRVTELLWVGLQNKELDNCNRIVAGDLNSSETFDNDWQKANNITSGLCINGNKEILNRMENLGFTECLRGRNKKIVPTFINSKGKKIIHQMDHLFVSQSIYKQIRHCNVGDQGVIFGQSISDHLPIIAEFENIDHQAISNNTHRKISSKLYGQIEKFTDFINNNTRIFAKTYADFAPHEYLVKKNLSIADQNILIEFAYFIKE